ncbi:MAG TPA: PEGA domain-containing protein [Polyangia bacterium]|nr:PEGA domain-containing protein [Polyangia bacterium]
MNRPLASTLVLVALAPLSTAAAQGKPADANDLILRGLDLRRTGRPAEALSLFRQAYEVAPSARTLGQMGLVESSLQLWVDADAHLTAALATPDDVWVHRNRRFLDQAMNRTQEHVGELAITGPAGTRVSVAGKPLGTLPVAPVRLAEGDVAVSAVADGHKPYAVEISIKGGARAAISIVLEPLALAAPNHEDEPAAAPLRPAPSKRRVRAGVALAAAGVAALAWGIGWIALDGRSPCDGCGSRYDTRAPGLFLVGGGGALALAGGALLFSAFHGPLLGSTVALTPRSVRFEARF